ncbi:unnamed protein product [Ectocarpus sp. CCAP 1310/34]|nr:unnamed protein product [Ectocarpus sp. CCAP 1310/34]
MRGVDAILPTIDDFCEAISSRGSPLLRCWGFLGGTIRKICSSGRWQRLYYNGWKRLHALKYQAVDSPDGFLRQLWGPALGRPHDVAQLGESDLLAVLMQSFNEGAANVELKPPKCKVHLSTTGFAMGWGYTNHTSYVRFPR